MKRRLWGLIGVAVVALGAEIAQGANVADIARLKGLERNTIMGMGIVIGLDGTGDESKDSLVAARPYAELLKNLGNPVAGIEELASADAYALVEVSMEIPATGAREGDRLDVRVNTLFNATSLSGGRLVVSLLRAPGPDTAESRVYAMASGPILIEGVNPRSGVVRAGGQMLANLVGQPVVNGTVSLVLADQYAGYPTAATLADAINDEFVLDGFPSIAMALDAKTVRVQVPSVYRDNAAEFLAPLMTVPIDPSLLQTKAKIVVNEERGIIAVSADVEISPIAITHEALSITIVTAPEDQVGGQEPVIEEKRWAGMNTTNPTGRGATRLQQLLAAMEQLNVSVSDQIAILFELQKAGALHAEIITE